MTKLTGIVDQSALLAGICGVVSNGSKEQVRGIHAGTDVTPVAYDQALRYWAMDLFPHVPMDTDMGPAVLAGSDGYVLTVCGIAATDGIAGPQPASRVGLGLNAAPDIQLHRERS